MNVLGPRAVAILALLPTLTTGLLLVLHEVGRAQPAATPACAAEPTPLRLPDGSELTRGRSGQRFELAPEPSRAGFESFDEISRMRAETHPLHGQIRFDSTGAPAALDVALDLTGFRHRIARRSGDLLWSLLGAREDSTTRLDLDSLRLRHTRISQVVEADAFGTLSLHGKVQSIRLQLQLAQIRPDRVRVQAVGEIDVRDFGLPRLYRLWVIPVDPQVKIWMDLVFVTGGSGADAK